MKMLILTLFLMSSLFARDDSSLIDLAYKSGLKPVPSDYESLLQELKIDSNQLSVSKIVLGKKLFFDKNLSFAKDISCASCHSFDTGGTDAKPTAIGHKGRENPFHLNTPTVLNTAFSKHLFWKGNSKTLEDQAKGPLQASFEMSITPKLAEKRIADNNEYRSLFSESFGSDEITFDKITEAIAAYERTLVTRGRYDDYLLGYYDSLNNDEKDGLEIFIKSGCAGCHNGIGLGGQALRKFPLSYHPIWSMESHKKIKEIQIKYNNVLDELNDKTARDDHNKKGNLIYSLGYDNVKLIEDGFFGKIKISDRTNVMVNEGCTKCHNEEDNNIKKENMVKIAFPIDNEGSFLGSDEQRGYFRVPLLRNVVQTKPYFHNGSVDKIEEAIKIMGIHQSRNRLSEHDIDKIVTFLKAVDGNITELY